MDYSRTQNAYRMTVFVMIGAVIVFVLLIPLLGGDIPDVFVLAIIALTVGLSVIFTRLTVTIQETSVTVAFGFGWPKRSIAFADIGAVRQVRNQWYHGWGMRLLKEGWMYNVWGLDAVELDLKSGRKFRIGTDDPDGLLAALTPSTVE